MHILMVAPQPFFRPRGTPFSVLHRIRGLTMLGHTVELVTYPFGETPSIAGLTIHRAPRLVLLMALVCLIFVATCVWSFIAARRRRQAGSGD